MSQGKYQAQDLRLVGQAHFDNRECPCPSITHSVKFGEEFQLVERMDKSLADLQAENNWAYARKIGDNGDPINEEPKKIPLKFMALRGSLETYTWFYGKFNRVQAICELDKAEYVQGTFLIRQNLDQENNYVLSVVAKQRTCEEAAEIKHFKIVQTKKKKKGCLAGSTMVVKFDGASKSTYPSIIELVGEKTKTQGGLPCTLNDKCRLSKDTNGGYLETTYDDVLFWEIENNALTMEEKLGAGSFGTVCRASFKDSPSFKVAVKYMHSKDGTVSDESFKRETDLMKGLYNENVITLMGITKHDEHGYGIVTELMEGAMDDKVKEMRNSQKCDLRLLFSWICCIASGMKYLASKKILHRDLRTANVLVKGKVAKVADFGVSKIMEELSANTSTQLPWRWTAPEVKERNRSDRGSEVTVAADVYSFGGLIYEVLQLGEQPFLQQVTRTPSNLPPATQLHTSMMQRGRTDLWIDKNNANIEPRIKQNFDTDMVAKGNIDYLKDVSIKCSAFKAEERPNFDQLTAELEKRFETFAGGFRKLNGRGGSYEEYQE